MKVIAIIGLFLVPGMLLAADEDEVRQVVQAFYTALPGSPAALAQPATPLACEALAGLAFANATTASATLVAAGKFQPPPPGFPPPPAGDYAAMPAFCRVTGAIHPTTNSDIRFELWLPAENWNGRFLQTGSGGAGGEFIYGPMAGPLIRGYAVAHTDTGHQGTQGEFTWAVGHPEQLTDYAHRAVHEVTVAGKALTMAHYGSAPPKSYWFGCSSGGRQGLKEAQRYPEDYDAIIAGAPANNWSALMTLSVMIRNNLGAGGLDVDKLGLLTEAAIASCDALDGVADRVITNTAQCGFDPAALQCSTGQGTQCLAPSEVTAARRIYGGVVASDGTVHIPGTGPASEAPWGAYASPQFAIGTSYFHNVVMNDPDWDPASFDIDRDLARAEALDGGEIEATDPDLSVFFALGGKLLTYHGPIDGLIPYGNSVNYYESVVAQMGAALTAEHLRFYLVPGMGHCGGGPGASQVDWLTALEDWAENGVAPAVLRGTHPASPPGAARASAAFTRPVCPYPQAAYYNSSGDAADAANFTCR